MLKGHRGQRERCVGGVGGRLEETRSVFPDVGILESGKERKVGGMRKRMR